MFNTGVGVRLIRCSHADAAESVYGAGGGGVRRRRGRRRVGGAGETRLSVAAGIKGQRSRGGRSDLSYRRVEGGGASGVLIPGTTEERRREMLRWSQNHRVGSASIQTQRSKQTAALGSKIQ